MAVEFVELEEVQLFFQIEDEDLDELLQYLIEHYSEVLIGKTGITEQNYLMKEAILFAIGCHLSKIKLSAISPTISYTVDDIDEEFKEPKAEETWCSLYKAKIEEILAGIESRTFGVVGIARKGLSDTFGSY